MSVFTRKISDLEELISNARAQIRDLKRMEKMSAKSHTELTPKQFQKLNADMNWMGMEMDKRLRSIHAIAVDLDVADIRAESYYNEVFYEPSGFHRYKHKPRKPRALSEATQ